MTAYRNRSKFIYKSPVLSLTKICGNDSAKEIYNKICRLWDLNQEKSPAFYNPKISPV